MKVKVETVGPKIRQMITLPDGSREFIQSERWDRKTATQVLDMLESVYGINRKSVRFKVR